VIRDSKRIFERGGSIDKGVFFISQYHFYILKGGKEYKMKKILTIALLGLAMVFGTASFAFAANTNSGTADAPSGVNYPSDYGIPDGTVEGITYDKTLNQSVTTDNDKYDNGINNANKTGENVGTNDGSSRTDVIKNVDGQRTHGQYQNNTNSCASCHQTHTGAGETLLFKDGVYTTCTACHDGTLGFYNVFANGMNASTAGTFGGTNDGNASVHLATGIMQVKAAPGGNKDADTEGGWTGDFNCASCHSPHGSYSDRLLAFNPNEMGKVPAAEGGKGLKVEADANENGVSNIFTVDKLAEFRDPYDATKLLGYTITGIDLTTDAGLAAAPRYVAVKGAADNALIGVAAQDPAAGTQTAIVVYKLFVGNPGHGEPSYYIKETSPWLYGYDYWAQNKPYWTRFYSQAALDAMKGANSKTDPTVTFHSGMFYNSVKDQWVQDTSLPKTDVMTQDTTGLKINFGKGFAYGTALNNAVGAQIAQAYVVKMDMVPIANYGGVPIYTVNEAALNGGNIDANGTLKGAAPIAAFSSAATYVKGDKVTYDGKVYSAKADVAAGGATPDKNTTGWSVVKAPTGTGVAMSQYCATCHTDYLASSGHETGTFDQAYRHTTTTDSYTCVRCHYAHGTDVQVMKDAHGDTVTSLVAGGQTQADAEAYMLDKNPSSALKRYTNMAVCYSCHTSSHAESFINVPDYQNNPNALHGMTDGDTATKLGAPSLGDIGKSSLSDATPNPIDPAVSQGYIR
jgi:predicted CXXCH cytochrome family protein